MHRCDHVLKRICNLLDVVMLCVSTISWRRQEVLGSAFALCTIAFLEYVQLSIWLRDRPNFSSWTERRTDNAHTSAEPDRYSGRHRR